MEVKRQVCLDSLTFQTTAGPLRWRNLLCWVDETDPTHMLVVDRPTMEQMGYSADALLAAVKKRLDSANSISGEPLPDPDISGLQKPFVRFLRRRDEALSCDIAEEQDCQLEGGMYTPSTCPVEQQMGQIQKLLTEKVQEAVENGVSSGW